MEDKKGAPDRRQLRYILESKKQKLTIEEAEAKHLIRDERLGRQPVPFGFMNQNWKLLISQLQDGDEVWEYYHYAGPLCAESGIAIIRDGEVVDHLPGKRS